MLLNNAELRKLYNYFNTYKNVPALDEVIEILDKLSIRYSFKEGIENEDALLMNWVQLDYVSNSIWTKFNSTPIRNLLKASLQKIIDYKFEHVSVALNLIDGRSAWEEEKDETAKNESHYPYIPLSYQQFLFVMENAILKCKRAGFAPKTFLDVGCGIASKLIFAELFFGLDVFGIEYTKESGYAGKRRLIERLPNYKGDKERVFIANALEFNDYSKYDIIYFYCPMSDQHMMHKLYKRVLEQMKNNSVMISVLTLESIFNAFRDVGIKTKKRFPEHTCYVIKKNNKFIVDWRA